MAEQNRPTSDALAPDTATSYERARPETESGMGRLDNNKGTPAHAPDSMFDAIKNQQNPENQLNAEDVVDSRANRTLHGKTAT